jgi:putative hemolysin
MKTMDPQETNLMSEEILSKTRSNFKMPIIIPIYFPKCIHETVCKYKNT